MNASDQSGWQVQHRPWHRVPSWVGSVLLLAALVLGAWSAWLNHLDNLAIENNAEMTLRLERLLSTMKDLETGQRGFLLTGEEQYLEPYNAALGVLGGELASVAELGLPIGQIPELVAARQKSASTGIDILKAQGRDAAIAAVKNGGGKALMDTIRAEVKQHNDEADVRIALRLRHLRHVVIPMALLAVGLGLLAFGAVGLLALRRRRSQLASAALLEGVLDNAPVGLGFLDSQLRVRHLNKALAAMSPETQSAGLGGSIWSVLPQLQDALETRLAGVLRGGKAISNVEVSPPPRPGERARHYQVSFYPLQTSQTKHEELDGAGMVVSDVTVRKRSEQRVRESEERFRSLTKAISTMVWRTDGDGRFTQPQPEWMAFTGQDFGSCKDLGWLDAVHPDDRASTSAAWAEALANGSVYTVAHRVRRADGAWRHMESTAVPILDDDGGTREWAGSHADVTERTEAELELQAAKNAAEAANRAKSVFLANMSHELRTPLSAVIGYSEMMEEEIEELGDVSLLGDLGKIKSNARHLLSLINDVLDLSKIEANRMDVFAEDLDVASLASDVASAVEALVGKRNNTLKVDVRPDLGSMHTDVVKLRQCLFNLLSNASKFTENGTITLQASRERRADGDRMQFRVTDTGIGMTPDQLERLFQRFSQADETTTRKFGGTGLGLAITRAFARLLGGDVTVNSIYGEGTTFIIDIPAVMPEQQDEEHERVEAASAKRAGTRGDVLVIDDDPAQRDLMSRFLERQGFTPHAAPEGETGLQMARTLKPRAILLDVMMPRMDGWSVLSALKADEELAKIPVVMITFLHDTGMGTALGAADYLTKPVHWEKLKEVMDRFRDAEGDVLIVDDDEDARLRLRTVLERSGWSTREAANGKEALDQVIHGLPRVILLDLTMPVMDGFSFLRLLRERPGCADVPVVVLTARDLSAADRHRLATADRVLMKAETSLHQITGELRALASLETAGTAAESSR